MNNTEQSSPETPVPAPHAEREHSKISPSKLKSLEICPQWLPDTKEAHAITQTGTKLHEALDKNFFDHLSDEEKILARACSDYTDRLKVSLPGCSVLNEIQLDILDGIWGFADHVIVHAGDKVAELVDYKFSTQLQESVETNPAAQAYALGLFKKFPSLQTIGVHYLYPRLDVVDTGSYSRSDCARIEARVKLIKQRVESGAPAMFVAENCLYCGRLVSCPLAQGKLLPIASRYQEAKGVQIPAVPDFSAVQDPKAWKQYLELAPLLEATADSIRRHAVEFRETSGQEIDGFELRTRAGKAKITDPIRAWAFAEKAGVTKEEFLACTEVSAKGLLDAVAEKAPRGKKGSVKQAFENTLRDEMVLEVGRDSHFMQKIKQTS